MKKIVFIFIAVLLSLSMSAQNFSHYTLSEVVDTVQYLNHNFVNQKSYFIGNLKFAANPFARTNLIVTRA